MHSAKSFFPTRADIPSRAARKSKLYRVCRDCPPQDPAYSTLQPQSTSNIFRQEGEAVVREVERPIGGEDLFRRMEQAAQERAQGRKLRRTSRQYHPRNVQTSIGNAKRTITDSNQAAVLDLRKISQQAHKATISEELLKSHQVYQPVNSERRKKEEPTSRRRGLTKSLHTIQHKFVPMHALERIDKQVQAHHDKSAILGEIDRARPLVQLCGDSYFQMTLRNRFEDDLKIPSFIYRIKDKLTENKVISRLRSTHPTMQVLNRIQQNEGIQYSRDTGRQNPPSSEEQQNLIAFFEIQRIQDILNDIHNRVMLLRLENG